MSRYLLIPVSEGEAKTILIPDGLISDDIYKDLEQHVINKNKLKWLLRQLALNDITEDDNGCVVCRDNNAVEIKFRDALIDICNNDFHEKYEKFYALLRNFNITF